ncbi:phage tail assembly chaperone [Brevundimonas sp. R86498]|uniref:phage tail assembly chaperone n=1 Tax=Brevundimonas sp. R86498 TaxID=3093845 RepID=UPI0037C8542B
MAETAWAGMLRAALALGVVPEAFWRLSLKEWRMLTSQPATTVSIVRSELNELMRAWPD